MAPLSGLLITEPKQGKTRTDSTYEWGNNGGKVKLVKAGDIKIVKCGRTTLIPHNEAVAYQARLEGGQL